MRRHLSHNSARAQPETNDELDDAVLPPADRSARLERIEERSKWFRAAAALVFLVAYSVRVITQPVGMAATATYAVMVAAWVSFVVDYAVRLFLAYDRRRWFVRNLLDLAIIAWPLFLPLRLFRLLLLITVIEKAVRRTVRGRVALYTAFSVVLLVYVCALSILQVERSQPDTTIKNFGDALWWSLETVTTVGYGDTAPHTGTGKWIAATLMIGGIGIVSVITASLASWILQRAALEGDGHNAATEAHIDAVRADVKQQIDALRADVQTLIDSLKGTADTAATMDDRASNRDVMRQ